MKGYLTMVCKKEIGSDIDGEVPQYDYSKLENLAQFMSVLNGMCKGFDGLEKTIRLHREDMLIESSYLVKGILIENKICSKDGKAFMETKLLFHSSFVSEDIIHYFMVMYGERNIKVDKLDQHSTLDYEHVN